MKELRAIACALSLLAASCAVIDLAPLVTKAEYDALQTGMHYQQAVAVIGNPGQEVSRNEIGGYVTIMYQWQNSDGTNMNAMFQNDALVQKAQFGLK